MEAGRRGGDSGFAAIYDEHVWKVYGFLGYRTRSSHDAEDLTQQTFERALRAWGRFDPERATVQTWLLAIARNLLIDHYRGDRSGETEPLDESAEVASDAEPSPEDGLGIDPDLAAALDALGERERELIALRFGGDLNGPEIAAMTGLSLANVHQVLSRSLRRLREQLTESEDAFRGRAA